MPTKRYSTEQIVNSLRQAEVELARGLRTPAVCKKLGICVQTYNRWRKEYSGWTRPSGSRRAVCWRVRRVTSPPVPAFSSARRNHGTTVV